MNPSLNGVVKIRPLWDGNDFVVNFVSDFGCFKLKSDHCGMEICQSIINEGEDGLKSDHCGMEIYCPCNPCSVTYVKIRPLWDGNVNS